MEVTPFETINNSFIQEYVDVVNSNNDINITEWLLDNYQRMSESMFYDRGWENLDVDAIITLRIYTPEKVFTETAKNGFLSIVGSNPKWTNIIKSIFVPTDYMFVTSLPEDKQAKVKTLVKFAYEKGIRKRDTNVMKM